MNMPLPDVCMGGRPRPAAPKPAKLPYSAVRSISTCFAAAAVLICLSFSSGAAPSQKRVALVIGNGAYQYVPRLPNPAKDAAAIADMFKKAGFDWVKLSQDVGNLQFKRALREFMDAATDADVAVVYYSGHGIQVRGLNYMIPVEARLATESDAENEAVSLDRIVMALEPAKRLRLVLLDACRENPFLRATKWRGDMPPPRRELAKVEPTLPETMIAYAAKAGTTAVDDGEKSPFTAALLKHLAVPGLDIRLAFGRVRDEVLKHTRNRQEPFVYGTLDGEAIALVPASVRPRIEALDDVKGDYQLVERIGTKRAWEIFLASHKEGLYVDLARAQLAKLIEAEAKSGLPSNRRPPPTPPKPSAPSVEEQSAWDRIKDSDDPAKLQDFIARYPASPLAQAAKNRLDVAGRAALERENKARADREAAQRREEEGKRLKAEEAARKLAEREAAQRRELEDKRLKPEDKPPASADGGRQKEVAANPASPPVLQPPSAGPIPVELGRRVALVIGNSDYRNAARLLNPRNDAEDVTAALRRIGFETIIGLDLDQEAMQEATIRFSRAARDADVAMVYYAGHAIQYAGVNYLLPVDVKLTDTADLRRLVRVDDIVGDLQRAKKLRVLVLDSCRDNPLADELRRAIGTSRSASVERGLARISNPHGMIVAYATQPGQTAQDGKGRNSPYTTAFLKQIETPEEIGTVFRRILNDVYEATERTQLPELSLSFVGEFYLRSRAEQTATPVARQP